MLGSGKVFIGRSQVAEEKNIFNLPNFLAQVKKEIEELERPNKRMIPSSNLIVSTNTFKREKRFKNFSFLVL
jgi:hypothetical protein